jgi:hypothetical protein
MVANKESDDDIQFVVDDFKQKYSQAEAPTEAAKMPLLDRIANSKISKGIQSFFPGAKLGEAIGTSLAAGEQVLRGNVRGTGGASDILKTQLSPKVVGADVASALLTAGGAALPVAKGATALGTIGKTALQSGVLGAGQAGSKTIAQGGTGEQALKNAAIGGATSAAISGTVSAFGELLKASGSKIVNTVIKPSQHDIDDGFSLDTIKKHNLGGSLTTMNSKTESKMSELSAQLAEKLKGSDATVDLQDAYKQTVQGLTGNKLRTFGSNTSMEKALEQLQDEISDVGNGALSIPDAQIVKQSSGKMGSWLFGAQDPDSTARQKVYNAFYRVLKENIEKNSPEGVKEINKQLSELIPISNAIARRIPIAERNNLLSLQDMITLTAGAIHPGALGGFALSLAQKSGAVGNLLMKTGPNIAKTAPILGQIGAQSVPSLSPQSQGVQGGISQQQLTSVDNTTLSPAVQRILNMRR